MNYCLTTDKDEKLTSESQQKAKSNESSVNKPASIILPSGGARDLFVFTIY